MSRDNGSVLGVDNTPTTSVASGIWSLNAVARAVKASIWPNNDPTLALDFDETTTLDSRITFTRATDGTYFDSSGVLQTASSGAARFGHRLESGVWVNKGLLIEEQRTNVNIYSEEFDNANWNKTNVTITADDETAPDGNTTADAVVENTTNAAHQVATNDAIGIAGNTKYTASVFLKKGTRDWAYVAMSNFGNFVNNPRAWFDLNNGVVGTLDTGADAATIQDCGNGWYRCTLSTTTVASPTVGSGVIVGCSSGDNVVTYAGTSGAKAIYAWGAQFETAAFPTSYIKTTTASVTRNADDAQMTSTNFSDWYNATEGSVFWQGDTVENPLTSGTGLSTFSINNGTNDNRLQQSIVASGSDIVLRTIVTVVNVEQANYDIIFPFTLNQTIKGSFAYKANDFASSVDGSAVATDTSGSLPTTDKINIGAINLAAGSLNGHLAKFYYWN